MRQQEPRRVGYLDHKERKYFVIALFGSVVLLSIELLYPLNFDNMIFQSMASELFRFHRYPYVGTWAHDMPGLVFLHWIGIVIFGDTAIGFRAFDAIVHIALSGLLFVLVRRWLSPLLAAVTVLFYNYHYISASSVVVQRDADRKST